MRLTKRIAAIIFSFFITLSFGNVSLISAKTLTGDLESDPISIEQKQEKASSITKNGHTKYFKVIVTETGNLTVSFSSDQLKSNGTLTLIYDDNGVYYDQATIKYSKKTKTAKAALTSSRIVASGQYRVVVNTDTVSKKTAFTLATKLKAYECKDQEPNEREDTAQKIQVKKGKQAVSYPMLLSGETFEQDLIDQFTFTLKQEQQIKITATAKGTDRIRILLKKKTADGSETINDTNSEQYFSLKNGKSVFSYTTKTPLEKGTYYIMVWLEDTQKIQVPYTIKVQQTD